MDENDILDSVNELTHYGVKYRSGRYPYGSGENPYQHNGDFVSRVKKLKSEGLTEKEIAKAMRYSSTTEYRLAYGIAKDFQRSLNVDRAKSLTKDGLTPVEIGKQMGVNESTVRSWLNESSERNMNAAKKVSEVLKKELETKGAIDVGAGVERELGVSKQKLNEAVMMLEMQGYNVYGVGVPQATDASKRTTIKVLASPTDDTKSQYRNLYQNPGQIQSIKDYHSEDGGFTFAKRERPSSISADRVAVRYGDKGGADRDGVIEIRRGVEDLSLGNSHYAQVRILVDGTHYLKGMAMYSDDIPDGYDILFNTNKNSGTPKNKVMKEVKDDPDNPFGAYIKAGGQSHYIGKDGKDHLSAINKLKEEGDWQESSRTLSSQFLSKQPMTLITKQLNLTLADYQSELDEINSLTNPTVKKKKLLEFADKCDSAAVHMKAAALPRQETRVILPVPQLKETEVYAPYLNDGEKVCLVRFPHGGTFEIPELTVNNKNPSAKRALGNAIDAVGINSKVAERLSGADFDGDTVIVIPVNNKVRIQTRTPFEGLQNFDPKVQYSTEGKTGVKLMSKEETQKQMGMISNLITDMTLRGAPDDEIERAVKHSMVVIDAAKHKLDYRQSEKDNGIAELKKKWQPKYDEEGNPTGKSGGASTLLSRRKQTTGVPERQGSGHIDPETGKIIYKESGRTYVDAKGKTVQAQTKVPLLQVTDDLRTLSSGTSPENAYAEYGNRLKLLASTARKEYLATPKLERSPSAAKVYEGEVEALNKKLDLAFKNAPRERRAHLLAQSVIKAKVQSNPELSDRANKKELAKIQKAAIEEARSKVGASSRASQIEITDKEWQAIQAGAISDSKLKSILRYADPDAITKRAMPKTTTQLSPAKISKIKAMQASGYTIAQIAEAVGVSTSTVSRNLK